VFLLSEVSFERVLPFALFGGVAAVVWLVLEAVSRGKSRATERLDELKDPMARRRKETNTLKKQDAMSKVLQKATPALARPLTPKNEFEANKLRAKLANAGFRTEGASGIYLGLKFACLIAGLFIASGNMIGFGEFSQKSILISVGIIGVMFYFPSLLLTLAVRSRQQNIFLGLPDALDLLVVCVEAGLGLDQAMRKVAEEMKKTYRVIADEFALANLQLQMGRSRSEVLHELGTRTGVDDVRSLSAILIQADKFGSSIAQALRVQSDSMRTRRRQLAEEKAAKTAVKLIFPLVIFIFPGIFVVLVGPAAITMVREMFPAMTGG
jgi:tight adherence protein C